jgi:hypothetical protein
MVSPAADLIDLIVLDTFGKLYAYGHGVNGYCRSCRRYFRRADADADRGPWRR